MIPENILSPASFFENYSFNSKIPHEIRVTYKLHLTQYALLFISFLGIWFWHILACLC